MTDEAAVVAALRDLLGPDAVVSEPHELTRYEQGWRYGRGKALAAVRPGSTGLWQITRPRRATRRRRGPGARRA